MKLVTLIKVRLHEIQNEVLPIGKYFRIQTEKKKKEML
jgi:hypothetical protein